MKIIITLIFFIFSMQTFASIVCHTPRMNKIFEINENKITFLESNNNQQRQIASIISRNKIDSKGLNKIVDFENLKHVIHIENINSFSDIDDYIQIKNNQGHEVIYPISCKNN